MAKHFDGNAWAINKSNATGVKERTAYFSKLKAENPPGNPSVSCVAGRRFEGICDIYASQSEFVGWIKD